MNGAPGPALTVCRLNVLGKVAPAAQQGVFTSQGHPSWPAIHLYSLAAAPSRLGHAP